MRKLLLAVGGAVIGVGTASAQVDLETVKAGRFDYGKMWTFEYAPQAYFTETYGFTADDAWSRVCWGVGSVGNDGTRARW